MSMIWQVDPVFVE